jgi:hypothetical protein
VNKTLELNKSTRKITNDIYDLAVDGDFDPDTEDEDLNPGASAYELLQEVYTNANPPTELGSEDEEENFMAAAFGAKEDREVHAMHLNNA